MSDRAGDQIATDATTAEGPRTWRIDAQPADVWEVQDRDDRRWWFDADERMWFSDDQLPCRWANLLQVWGPITEIRGNGLGYAAGRRQRAVEAATRLWERHQSRAVPLGMYRDADLITVLRYVQDVVATSGDDPGIRS